MRNVVLSDCASIDRDALRQGDAHARGEADVQRQALRGARTASAAEMAAASGGRSYAGGVWGWLTARSPSQVQRDGQAGATGAAAGPPSGHSSQTAGSGDREPGAVRRAWR